MHYQENGLGRPPSIVMGSTSVGLRSFHLDGFFQPAIVSTSKFSEYLVKVKQRLPTNQEACSLMARVSN